MYIPKNFIEISPINFKRNVGESHILKHCYGRRANLEIHPASENIMLW